MKKRWQVVNKGTGGIIATRLTKEEAEEAMAFAANLYKEITDMEVQQINIIVTRHQPLIDWLAARGITGEVIAQATVEDVRGLHVYGVLPLWLAAEAESVTEVSMPDITLEQRKRNASGDMSVEEMDAAGAHMVTYKVVKQ